MGKVIQEALLGAAVGVLYFWCIVAVFAASCAALGGAIWLVRWILSRG